MRLPIVGIMTCRGWLCRKMVAAAGGAKSVGTWRGRSVVGGPFCFTEPLVGLTVFCYQPRRLRVVASVLLVGSAPCSSQDPEHAMDLKQVGYRAYEGSYRGKHVRIWGEHADGGFGRIQRWWNYETCGHTETGINELEAAKRQARSTINQELDGRADYRFMWRDLFLKIRGTCSPVVESRRIRSQKKHGEKFRRSRKKRKR